MTTQWAYRTRPVEFMELWRPSPHRVCKVYGISTTGPTPRVELVEAAKRIAVDIIPDGSPTDDVDQTAVLICHDAGGSCWALIQWWVDSAILRSFVYRADGDTPGDLTEGPAGITACVWELEVIDFERRAWTNLMLNTDSPDLDAYLAAQLSTDL